MKKIELYVLVLALVASGCWSEQKSADKDSSDMESPANCFSSERDLITAK